MTKYLPCTIWLTGLSAAGKTTLAYALAAELSALDIAHEVLDGDVVRKSLSRDLGFSSADRSENVRRVAARCRELNDQKITAIAALISPYRVDRDLARQLIGADRFIETFLSTPLEVCEARDPKGLYRKARSGEITNLSGIGDVYEEPVAPKLKFDTSRQSTSDSVAAVLRLLSLQDAVIVAPTE
jgi:adenylylsulfate kinase